MRKKQIASISLQPSQDITREHLVNSEYILLQPRSKYFKKKIV